MRKSKIRFPGIKYVPLVNIKSHIKYELPIEYRKSEEFGGKRDSLPYSIPLRGKNLPNNKKDSGRVSGSLLLYQGVQYALITEKPISEIKTKIVKGLGATSIKEFNTSFQLNHKDGAAKINIDAQNKGNKIKSTKTSVRVDKSDQVIFKGGQAKDFFDIASSDFYNLPRYKNINVNSGEGDDDIGTSRHISVNSNFRLGGGNDKLSIDGSVTKKLFIDAGEGDDIIDWSSSVTRNGKVKINLGDGSDSVRIGQFDSFSDKLPKRLEINFGKGANEDLEISGTLNDLKRLKLVVSKSGKKTENNNAKIDINVKGYHDDSYLHELQNGIRNWEIPGYTFGQIDDITYLKYNGVYISFFTAYGADDAKALVRLDLI